MVCKTGKTEMRTEKHTKLMGANRKNPKRKNNMNVDVVGGAQRTDPEQ